MTRLGDATSPEIEAQLGLILVVPLGATEQHGPHLPLSTDTDLADELCRRLACARDDVVVAPPLAYGASGEHAGFAGTLSIGSEALRLVLIELVRSACESFGHVVLVSAHGGNADAVRRAVKTLHEDSRDVLAFSPRWEGDPHAGRPETSMQLALSPHRVRSDRIAAGDTRPLADVWPILRTDGVRAVSPSGVLGDPTGATASDGEALLERLAAQLIDAVAVWRQPVEAGR